jgi:hypothetical protein
LRDDALAVVEHDKMPRVDLLRRLKREFSYFSIELHAGEGNSHNPD